MTPQKTLRVANTSMCLTLLAFATCVYVAYFMDDYFPLMVIVLMHVAQIILAGVFKFSYVLRLVAQKQLGQSLR